jgi:hypothetical protein
MSATGSSVTTSTVPALAPCAPSLSAIGNVSSNIFHAASSHFHPPSLTARRNVHDPRALAVILEKAEEELARKRHPDPYIRAFPNKDSLTPHSSTHLYDAIHLQQIQHTLVVQSGASVIPRAL